MWSTGIPRFLGLQRADSNPFLVAIGAKAPRNLSNTTSRFKCPVATILEMLTQLFQNLCRPSHDVLQLHKQKDQSHGRGLLSLIQHRLTRTSHVTGARHFAAASIGVASRNGGAYWFWHEQHALRWDEHYVLELHNSNVYLSTNLAAVELKNIPVKQPFYVPLISDIYSYQQITSLCSSIRYKEKLNSSRQVPAHLTEIKSDV